MEISKFKLQSMTGFGRGVYEKDGLLCICEIRSVNLRGLDVKLRLPKELFSFETDYIKKVQKLFSRGRIDIHITINNKLGQQRKINFNTQAASNLVSEINDFCKNKNEIDPTIRAGDLLYLNELFTIEDILDLSSIIKPIAEKSINIALKDLLSARITEGKNIFPAIFKSLADCKNMVTKLKKQLHKIPAEHYNLLRQRITELITEQGIDHVRIVQEAAFLADKSDVAEEIERLQAHFKHFYSLCTIKSSGRKLDFLCQEMFRESNTIGSKCSNATSAHLVVDIKAEIERLREQVQNVE